MAEGIACVEQRRARLRRIPEDIEVTIGKKRASTPHYWEMEAIARRGF